MFYFSNFPIGGFKNNDYVSEFVESDENEILLLKLVFLFVNEGIFPFSFSESWMTVIDELRKIVQEKPPDSIFPQKFYFKFNLLQLIHHTWIIAQFSYTRGEIFFL